jgi:excisionase family DNA binding protein
MSERLLTTRDVAELLAVSPETVLRRWRSGELPGYRLASNVLRFREHGWSRSVADSLNGIGLVLGFVGAMLLFFFNVPRFPTREDAGNIRLILEQDDEDEKERVKWADRGAGSVLCCSPSGSRSNSQDWFVARE